MMLMSFLNGVRSRAEARARREASRLRFLVKAYDWEIPQSYLNLSPDERKDIARLLRRRADILKNSIELRAKLMEPEALEKARAEQRELIAIADLVTALEQDRFSRSSESRV